jgi:tagatose 6-phosphate kinase
VSRPTSAATRPDLLAVGVNPAVDVYYDLDRFCPGGVNRVRSVRTAAGGKANNLARAYRRLGGRPLTTGIAGGETGRRVLAGLTEEGIDHDFVSGEGETRQTVTVVTGGSTTVLLEPGPRVESAALDALEGKVTTWATEVPAVAIAGSLPPGAPEPYLARLVQRVRQGSPAFVALDASGGALRLAAQAGPHLIKVNVEEFERAFAQPARDRPGLEGRFGSLLEASVETLCLTDGARGALVMTAADSFVVRTEAGAPVSTAGAGDAFLAGLLFALRRGDGLREAARLASASSAAALAAIGAGFIEPAAVEAALARTRLLDVAAFFAERWP